MQYRIHEPKDGTTTRVYIVRRDEVALGLEVETQVNQDCIEREANGKDQVKIYVSRRRSRRSLGHASSGQTGAKLGSAARDSTCMRRHSSATRHEHPSGAQTVAGAGMYDLHEVRFRRP